MTVFPDRSPATPVHVLIVPNRHITSLNHIMEEDTATLGRLLVVAQKMAEQLGISQSGYRVILNTGANAGQTVFHLHLHLMGGQKMTGLTR